MACRPADAGHALTGSGVSSAVRPRGLRPISRENVGVSRTVRARGSVQCCHGAERGFRLQESSVCVWLNVPPGRLLTDFRRFSSGTCQKIWPHTLAGRRRVRQYFDHCLDGFGIVAIRRCSIWNPFCTEDSHFFLSRYNPGPDLRIRLTVRWV